LAGVVGMRTQDEIMVGYVSENSIRPMTQDEVVAFIKLQRTREIIAIIDRHVIDQRDYYNFTKSKYEQGICTRKLNLLEILKQEILS
jgi:hypothetical protein